jgi:hypothetical protein
MNMVRGEHTEHLEETWNEHKFLVRKRDRLEEQDVGRANFMII